MYMYEHTQACTRTHLVQPNRLVAPKVCSSPALLVSTLLLKLGRSRWATRTKPEAPPLLLRVVGAK